MAEKMNSINKAVALARTKFLRLKQKELAEMTNMNKGYITQMETGRCKIKTGHLMVLSQAIGCSFFLWGTGCCVFSPKETPRVLSWIAKKKDGRPFAIKDTMLVQTLHVLAFTERCSFLVFADGTCMIWPNNTRTIINRCVSRARNRPDKKRKRKKR